MKTYQIRVRHNIHGYTDFITRVITEVELNNLYDLIDKQDTFEVIMLQEVIEGMPKLGEKVHAYGGLYGYVSFMHEGRLGILLPSGSEYQTNLIDWIKENA